MRSPTRPAPPPHAVHRAWGVLLLVALVLLGIARSHLGTRLDSFTIDEPWHIVAGTSYVRSGDFRLNPEHPPLAKLWVGAAMADDFKLRPTPALAEKLQERDLVEETMFYDNDPARAQRIARIAMWSLHGLLLLTLGLLLWHALGLPWAAGSLAFLAIEPTVAAHLPVVMTDLPLALALLVAAVCGGLLASQWRWRWVAGFGLSLGLALGAKHSALAGVAGITAVATAAALWPLRGGSPRTALTRLGKLALAGLLGVAVLWAQYGFQFHASPGGTDGFNRSLPDKIADISSPGWRRGITLADRAHLLPRSYLWGLADTVRTGVEGRGISQHLVWGRVHDGQAPWSSWPLIIASKVPLALMLLALLGACMLWRAELSWEAKLVLWSVLGGTTAHLAALLASEGIWGGVRHAMPLVVALSIPAGAAVARNRDRPPHQHAAGLVADVTYLVAPGIRGQPQLQRVAPAGVGVVFVPGIPGVGPGHRNVIVAPVRPGPGHAHGGTGHAGRGRIHAGIQLDDDRQRDTCSGDLAFGARPVGGPPHVHVVHAARQLHRDGPGIGGFVQDLAGRTVADRPGQALPDDRPPAWSVASRLTSTVGTASVPEAGASACVALISSSAARNSLASSATKKRPPVASAMQLSSPFAPASSAPSPNPTVCTVRPIPIAARLAAAWQGSRWHVSWPSETRITVASFSVNFRASAACSTAAASGVMPTGLMRAIALPIASRSVPTGTSVWMSPQSPLRLCP